MPRPHIEPAHSAHQLHSVNDSKFEILVAGYLRRCHLELVGLIATGINENGEPIPCPVDGILYIPGTLPRCIAVAATTIARKDLSRKWLGGANKPGDILKAVDEFQAWKRDIPGVECLVYVATNQPLKSDTLLYRQAIKQGYDHGIHVHVIESSQLTDFLDHDPDGQYLRETILGIDAERLSEDLLRAIARHSLDFHRVQFSVGRSDHGSEIVRDAHARVLDSLASKSLIGIQGASGTGKSTLLRQIGISINASGGLALWIPAEEIVQGTPIATIVLRVLRRFHPSLNPRAGDDALHLASVLPSGLTLLVDDVNRLASPHQTLTTIQALTTTVYADTAPTTRQNSSWVRFIVPLWPGQLGSHLGNQLQDYAGWEIIALSTYSAQERSAIAKHVATKLPTGVHHMIEALNGDPFLCGLAATMTPPSTDMSRAVLTAQIFSEVVYRATNDAARLGQITATPGEFVTALDRLMEFLLRSGNPEPEWHQVRATVGDRNADLLYVLSTTNQLSWVEQANHQETWRWKHDRLRDALLGRWLAQNAVPHVVRNDLSEELKTWLADPGLAEAWALSLAFLVDKSQQASMLMALGEHNPLALAEILRLNLFPQEKDLRQLIATGLRQAIEHYDETSRDFVGSPQRWILAKLSQTNDPLVLEITHGLNRSWSIWAARLRNGDIWSGLQWISHETDRHEFLPTVRIVPLEQSIEALTTLYDQQRHIVVREFAEAIGQQADVVALMTLAGYLAWPELSLPIWEAWNRLNHAEQLKTLAPLVWALSRGADQSMQDRLEAALLLVQEISDEERVDGKVHHGSERYEEFMDPFRLAQRWAFTPHAAQTWARVATQYSDILKTLCYVLRLIDHPDALETYVRWSAARGGTFWDEAFESIDPLTSADVPKIPVSQAARDRLWSMFEHEADQTTRIVAFRFWKRMVTPGDMERLQSIPTSDAQFEEVLKVRLKLRDRTATNLLIQRMKSEPGLWCGYAPLLYEEMGVRDTLLSQLELALKDPQERSKAIGWHLSAEWLRDLLQNKGDVLRRSPRTWPYLWRSEVPEALDFIRDAVTNAATEELEHFFFRFGFPFPVTRRMLDTFIPSLERFPKVERERLAELAIRGGFRHWAEEYLPDVIFDEETKHRWLTRDAVVEILTAAAAVVPQDVLAVYRESGFLRLERRFWGEDTVDIDILGVVRTWLGTAPDANQLIIAAMLVADTGTNRDIEWWQAVEPVDDKSHSVWGNTFYILQRRRWQRANSDGIV